MYSTFTFWKKKKVGYKRSKICSWKKNSKFLKNFQKKFFILFFKNTFVSACTTLSPPNFTSWIPQLSYEFWSTKKYWKLVFVAQHTTNENIWAHIQAIAHTNPENVTQTWLKKFEKSPELVQRECAAYGTGLSQTPNSTQKLKNKLWNHQWSTIGPTTIVKNWSNWFFWNKNIKSIQYILPNIYDFFIFQFMSYRSQFLIFLDAWKCV